VTTMTTAESEQHTPFDGLETRNHRIKRSIWSQRSIEWEPPKVDRFNLSLIHSLLVCTYFSGMSPELGDDLASQRCQDRYSHPQIAGNCLLSACSQIMEGNVRFDNIPSEDRFWYA
jgi:hypothetical protein